MAMDAGCAGYSGSTLFFTGVPRAGKSTLAHQAWKEFRGDRCFEKDRRARTRESLQGHLSFTSNGIRQERKAAHSNLFGAGLLRRRYRHVQSTRRHQCDHVLCSAYLRDDGPRKKQRIVTGRVHWCYEHGFHTRGHRSDRQTGEKNLADHRIFRDHTLTWSRLVGVLYERVWWLFSDDLSHHLHRIVCNVARCGDLGVHL